MPPPTVKGIKSWLAVRRTVSEQRVPRLGCRRDVEQNNFVSARLAVRRGQFGRIAGIAQLHKLNALHHASGVNVEAGDDALGQASQRAQKFSRILHSDIAGFFRMKLHAEQVAVFRRSREWGFVDTGGDSIRTQRRPIGMGEIHVGVRRNVAQQPRARINCDAVPANVRRFHLVGESRAFAWKDSYSSQLRCLLAAFEHPLQAQANAEHRVWLAIALRTAAPSAPSLKGRVASKLPTPGMISFSAPEHNVGVVGHHALAAQMPDGLHH